MKHATDKVTCPACEGGQYAECLCRGRGGCVACNDTERILCQTCEGKGTTTRGHAATELLEADEPLRFTGGFTTADIRQAVRTLEAAAPARPTVVYMHPEQMKALHPRPTSRGFRRGAG